MSVTTTRVRWLRDRRLSWLSLLATAALLAGSSVSATASTPGGTRPAGAGEQLKGVFGIEAANCGTTVSGSWFQMIQPGGGAEGPYVQNLDSSCRDKTHTPLAPGRDGGLSTVDYQPAPNPPFDVAGNATGDRITTPAGFFGVKFATATSEVDPQTHVDVPKPIVTHDGAGNLSGDLRSFAAQWNHQHFNQGTPKPDSTAPGLTAGPGGTYDPVTGRYSLEWTSTIVGGPFNQFTGRWHLEGIFHPAGLATPPAAPTLPTPPGDGGNLLPLPALPGLPELPAVPALPGLTGHPSSAAPAAPARPLAAQNSGAGELNGLFRLTAAACATPSVTGSYFRMIQPGGSTGTGPYLQNGGSACADRTYTPLAPGKDGGLSTVAYQPHPNPPFDGTNSGANDRITLPQDFFGNKFSTATNATDPQTNTAAPRPVITVDGAGKLSGDLSAFAAAWNGQHFNQGSPKPDHSTPGATTLPAGTYDAATKKFTLQWTSTIVGGPFDKFTGQWHFEGTFEPAATGATPAPVPAAPRSPEPAVAKGTVAAAASPAPSPSLASPATKTDRPATTARAAVGTMARTGPAWPARLPTALLALAWLAHRRSRRTPAGPQGEVSGR